MSLYRDFITLPSYAITFAMLCKRRDFEFFIPPQSVQPTLKNTINGGLSISVRRYHNNMTNPLCKPKNFFGQTYIRNNPEYPFKTLTCWDATSLYLKTFSGKTAVGPAYLRKSPDFQPSLEQSEFPNSSRACLEYCLFLEQNGMPFLQYYGGGGALRDEPKILGRPVDALNPEDGTVILFHGCVFHSCKKCYPSDNSPHPFIKNMTHAQIRQRDAEFQKLLVSAGYSVRIKYGCQWEDDKKTLPAAMKFADACTDVRLGKNRFDPQGSGNHLIKDESTLLDAIKNGTLFGFLECTVRHPNPRADTFFMDLPPVIKNVLVSMRAVACKIYIS